MLCEATPGIAVIPDEHGGRHAGARPVWPGSGGAERGLPEQHRLHLGRLPRLLLMLTLAHAVTGGEGALDWHAILAKTDGDGANAKAAIGEGLAIDHGEFSLSATMAVDEPLTCSYMTPSLSLALRPARAGECVFYFHTPGDKEPLANDMCQRQYRECGFTVFSILFAKSSQLSYYFQSPTHSQFYS